MLYNMYKGGDFMTKFNKAQYDILHCTLDLIHLNLDVNRPFSKEYADAFIYHDVAMFFASTDSSYSMTDTEEKRRSTVKLHNYILSEEMNIDEAIRMAVGEFEVVDAKIDGSATKRLNKAQYRIFQGTLQTVRDNIPNNRNLAEALEDMFVVHDIAMYFASTEGDGLVADTEEKRERNKKLYEYVFSEDMDIDEAIRIAIGDFEVVA